MYSQVNFPFLNSEHPYSLLPKIFINLPKTNLQAHLMKGPTADFQPPVISASITKSATDVYIQVILLLNKQAQQMLILLL